MDIHKIVQLRLLKKDLPKFKPNNKYWFDTVTSFNLNDYIDKLKLVSQLIHTELNWDGAPTINDSIDRLNFGSVCNLFMYGDLCIGWYWTNSYCITEDWKTEYQKIKSNEIYIGGAFLSRILKPSSSSSYYFYRQGFEYSLLRENKDTMYLYSDDWNRASAQLSYRCGFHKFNFITENYGTEH